MGCQHNQHKLTLEAAKDPFDIVALSPVAAKTAVVWNSVTSFTIQPKMVDALDERSWISKIGMYISPELTKASVRTRVGLDIADVNTISNVVLQMIFKATTLEKLRKQLKRVPRYTYRTSNQNKKPSLEHFS
jgi:hypothetical protein